jgi:catechol 2,3-dioxygenase-like lactoylglutathione lyase family enzyme
MSSGAGAGLNERQHEQEDQMSKVQSQLKLTKVGRVVVPTADVDAALHFYVDTLGFEKVVDAPMGDAGRWVEVKVAGGETTIAISTPPLGKQVGGAETGIIIDTTDIDADHAALKDAGVDVDEEVSRYGGPVPPMFWLRDPEGNALIVVQPND